MRPILGRRHDWTVMLAAVLYRPLFIALAWLCLNAAQAQTLRTVQQSNSMAKYAPGDGDRPGICMEILRAVEQVDPRLRFSGLDKQAPLRRVEIMLAQGQIDVFFCLLKSAERERQWRYLPLPLYRIQHVVAMRQDDAPEPRHLADLVATSELKPVVVTRGTVLADTLRKAGVSISEVASDFEALQMLVLGRTDLVYGQDLNLLRHLREFRSGEKLRIASTVFQTDQQYLAVGRKVPPAVEQRLLQALQKLEREGRLKAISDKYR